jgi:hypothetical protein
MYARRFMFRRLFISLFAWLEQWNSYSVDRMEPKICVSHYQMKRLANATRNRLASENYSYYAHIVFAYSDKYILMTLFIIWNLDIVVRFHEYFYDYYFSRITIATMWRVNFQSNCNIRAFTDNLNYTLWQDNTKNTEQSGEIKMSIWLLY